MCNFGHFTDVYSPSLVWLWTTVQKCCLCKIECCNIKKILSVLSAFLSKMSSLFLAETWYQLHTVVTSLWRSLHADTFAKINWSNVLLLSLLSSFYHLGKECSCWCEVVCDSIQSGRRCRAEDTLNCKTVCNCGASLF